MTISLHYGTYQKKPMKVTAVFLETENAQNVARWCGGFISWVDDEENGGRYPRGVYIDTLEGRMFAECDYYYVVRGHAGEFWPVRGDIFDQTYEEC